MRFQIEKLEERIAPSHAGAVPNQTQTATGIGNGNGPHSTNLTFTQVGSSSGHQTQALTGIGNGNGPHTTNITLTQIGSPSSSSSCW